MTTALTRYRRLESEGIWRPEAGAQRRDVVVVLGDASLTLLDGRTEQVLAHWSLPAIRRLNPGQVPALLVPGLEDDRPTAQTAAAQAEAAQDGETLELTDPLLIEALEAIDRVLRPPPRRHRLRLAVGLGSALLVVLAGALWLPAALADHTARIVPQASRAQIARAVTDSLPASIDGARVCAYPGGRQALTTLRVRVLGSGYRVMAVSGLPAGFEAAHLPGRVILLGEALLNRLDTPEALAGYLLAESTQAATQDPLRDVLNHAGLRATLSLLATGHLPAGALEGYAARRLSLPAASPDLQALAAAMAALGLAPDAYIAARGGAADALPAAMAEVMAEATTAREANPEALPSGTEPMGRLLGDGEWLMLQAVCDA